MSNKLTQYPLGIEFLCMKKETANAQSPFCVYRVISKMNSINPLLDYLQVFCYYPYYPFSPLVLKYL